MASSSTDEGMRNRAPLIWMIARMGALSKPKARGAPTTPSGPVMPTSTLRPSCTNHERHHSLIQKIGVRNFVALFVKNLVLRHIHFFQKWAHSHEFIFRDSKQYLVLNRLSVAISPGRQRYRNGPKLPVQRRNVGKSHFAFPFHANWMSGG